MDSSIKVRVMASASSSRPDQLVPRISLFGTIDRMVGYSRHYFFLPALTILADFCIWEVFGTGFCCLVWRNRSELTGEENCRKKVVELEEDGSLCAGKIRGLFARVLVSSQIRPIRPMVRGSGAFVIGNAPLDGSE